MEIYGGEGCCDGGMDIRFKNNNSEWKKYEELKTVLNETIP